MTDLIVMYISFFQNMTTLQTAIYGAFVCALMTVVGRKAVQWTTLEYNDLKADQIRKEEEG